MKVRHARQALLAEVGEAGQQRLGEARLAVPGDGVAARVQARYLAGAGVAALRVESREAAEAAREVDATVEVGVLVPGSVGGAAPTPDPSWAAALAPPARDVALGAWRALDALRRAVRP